MFKRTAYSDLNARQKENYNFHKVAARLADYGFNCIRVSDDWQGADLIAANIDGENFLKVQLKGRLVIDKKYLGKAIFIAFFHRDDLYVYDHDAFVSHVIDQNRIGEGSITWHNDGFRTWPSPPAWARQFLAQYLVGAII